MSQINTKESQNEARSKLIQVFRYIQAFNYLQNPVQQDIHKQPWNMWFHDLPNHPDIRLYTSSSVNNIDEHTRTTSPLRDNANDEDFILKVRRPKIKEAPLPPEELVPYLQPDWQNIDIPATIEPTTMSSFKNNPRLAALFEDWQTRRNKWIESGRPALQVVSIFDKLYELRTQLERESERLELMLGDGILSWRTRNSSTAVYHPILLIRLQLLFNPQIPEFKLVETDNPPELYTPLLQTIQDSFQIKQFHIEIQMFL